MRIHQERAAEAKDRKVCDEIVEYWRWNGERVFLESLKAVHESQRGVGLSYDQFPVTKTDPAPAARTTRGGGEQAPVFRRLRRGNRELLPGHLAGDRGPRDVRRGQAVLLQRSH
jgi:hypothetical protein